MNNLGLYDLIYPPVQPSQLKYYEQLLSQAYVNWEELTTGRKR